MHIVWINIEIARICIHCNLIAGFFLWNNYCCGTFYNSLFIIKKGISQCRMWIFLVAFGVMVLSKFGNVHKSSIKLDNLLRSRSTIFQAVNRKKVLCKYLHMQRRYNSVKYWRRPIIYLNSKKGSAKSQSSY